MKGEAMKHAVNRRTLDFALVLVGVLALIALGGVAVVAGEADDSPGLQGIGVLIVIGASVAALRWRGGRGDRGGRGERGGRASGGRSDAPDSRDAH